MGHNSVLFFIALLADLALIWLDSPHRWMSKSLIVPILMFGYVLGSRRLLSKLDILFLVGLLFAWGGDLLLLRDSFFLFGLGSFLLMQLCFSVHFWQYQEGWRAQSLVSAIVLMAITISMLAWLWPSLGDLSIAVLCYCAAISSMCFLAWQRKRALSGYSLVAVGAFLFVISDGVIAIHRFTDLNLGKLTVMITYGLAIWAITEGVLRSNNRQTA